MDISKFEYEYLREDGLTLFNGFFEESAIIGLDIRPFIVAEIEYNLFNAIVDRMQIKLYYN